MAKHPPCKATGDVGVVENKELGLEVNDFTRSHPFTPERTYIPKTKRELVSAILDGEARGGRMKARGGCYSLSAAQNPDDFLIDTRLLDKYLSRPFPRENSKGAPIEFQESRMRANENLAAIIRSDFARPTDRRHLVHVEAGIGIKALLKDLSIAGLGLPTMGAGGSQTLAGAISTGTHGSDYDLAPLGDFVKALHIVGPGGREWWIEPSTGLIGARGPGELHDWCPGTRIVRDDELFEAALVSVGRLGVIYSVVLEVREDYRLEDRSHETKWATVRKELRDTAKDPSSTSVFVQTASRRYYAATIDLASRERCWVTKRRETTNDDNVTTSKGQKFLCDDPNSFGLAATVGAFHPEVKALEATALAVPGAGIFWAARIMAFWFELTDLAHKSRTIGDFLLAAVQKITALPESEVGPAQYHALREIIRQVAGDLVGSVHPELQRGPSSKILDQHNYAIDNCYSGDSLELFFDAHDEKYLAFIDDVLAIATRRGLVPGYVSLRFTKKSQAVLAMQQFERTVAIEIAVPRLSDGTALFEPFMQETLLLGRQAGGIPHWGQKHILTPSDLDAFYPRIEAFRWALAEFETEEKKTFSSAFTRARGLETEDDKTLSDYRAPRSGGVLVASLVPLLF